MASGKYIYHYYDGSLETIRNEILSQTDSYLLSVDIDEYESYLMESNSLSEITIDETREKQIKKFRRTQETDDYGTRRTTEILWLQIMLPVIDDPRIDLLLDLQTSGNIFGQQHMYYQEGFVIAEAPANESDVNSTYNRMIREIDQRNTDVKKHNGELRSQIRTMIHSRRSQIDNEDSLIQEITAKVSIPLKYKADPRTVLPTSVKVKKKIQPIYPPKAKERVTPELKDEQFNGVLEIIDNCCRLFERTSGTFSKLEEEDLRNVILSNLNGIFEGDAVGEAFSKAWENGHISQN